MVLQCILPEILNFSYKKWYSQCIHMSKGHLLKPLTIIFNDHVVIIMITIIMINSSQKYTNSSQKYTFSWYKSLIASPYDPVARRRQEECFLVVDEEEVSLALVKGRGEVVGIGVHDLVRQTEWCTEPGERHLAVLRDVVDFEGHLDLQDVSVSGQHVPGCVDL